MKYAFDHSEILDEIPPDAELVILPKGDPELYEANKRLAESLSKEGKKVVVVNLQKPRIPKPKIAHLGA
jgi:protein-tyrosine phosphatase